MGNSNSTGTSFANVLSYILVVLLVVGIAGAFVYLFTGNNDVVESDFYVQYGEDKFYSDSEETYLISLDTGDNSFIVNSDDFSLTISSDSDSNFDFSCNDSNYKFYSGNSSSDDFTSLFDVSYSDEGFLITIEEGFNLVSLLESKYGGDVSISSELNYDSYFVLSVISGDESINIKLSGISLYGIELSDSALAF